MTEERREQQKVIEPLINRDILRATFTDPKFLAHLASMAHHAHLNMSESGFSVQSVGGVPTISELIRSPRMGSIEDVWASFSSDINALKDEEIDILGIPKTPKEETPSESLKRRIKPGIILQVHSHPFDRKQESVPEDVLMPSSKDLDSWEDFKLATKNLLLIEGILVPRGNMALLLLYQADPNKTQVNYYQAWGGRSRNELLGLMEDSGIRHKTLTFDIKGKKFPEEELDKLKTFET